MARRVLFLVLAFGVTGPAVRGAELSIIPPEVRLTGPHATQRIVVLEVEKGHVTREVTSEAKLSVGDPKVVLLDGALISAAGDGETTIIAEHGGRRATVKVHVDKTQEPFTYSFGNHVIPVLTRLGCNSGACHGALAGKGGFKLSLRGYAPGDDHFVLTRQALSRRVNRVEPAHSLMLLKPTLALPHGGGQRMEVGSREYHVLADWIASGAPAPNAKDAKIESLVVLPVEAILRPKDSLQMVVRARYSDGHLEDVTRLARFSSTEDLIVGVDENGLLKVSGHGEAAINVSFSNLVATARILSPFAGPLDPKLFAAAPKHNFIDDLVLSKLQALRIPPSPQCSDSEFIRRAYLDCLGILPTPDEVQAFLNDAADAKRTRLIASLVERPEFVDYWSYKWSDVLLISSRKLSQPAMRSFYQFVRQSVADNKPWDQFAREILTARGSNLQSGAANYFVLHKEITALTETTSVTFLGMSITCARCHNHPLEKWTQDQYWGMANLFSRVAIKNGERAGEVTVQSLPEGDVLHPRRGIAMKPAPLDAKELSFDSPKDRREHFADWLTSKDNPYFARALVNRVWRNFLSRGLVEAEDDLRQTNPATNEELLSALAKDFIAHGYDVKHLIGTIMNSATYQRSSVALPENKADDRFYSRYLIRRLPAEVVLDAYAYVTEVPTAFTQINVGVTGGQAGTTDYPRGMRALQLPDTQLVSQFLDAFGRPERGQPCSCERQQESSVTQALHLSNGTTLNDRLRDKGSRIEKWLKEKISDEQAVRRVFMLGLSREPNAMELQRFTQLMSDAAREPMTTRREVLEDLFWAVLTGKEFLFNR